MRHDEPRAASHRVIPAQAGIQRVHSVQRSEQRQSVQIMVIGDWATVGLARRLAAAHRHHQLQPIAIGQPFLIVAAFRHDVAVALIATRLPVSDKWAIKPAHVIAAGRVLASPLRTI